MGDCDCVVIIWKESVQDMQYQKKRGRPLGFICPVILSVSLCLEFHHVLFMVFETWLGQVSHKLEKGRLDVIYDSVVATQPIQHPIPQLFVNATNNFKRLLLWAFAYYQVTTKGKESRGLDESRLLFVGWYHVITPKMFDLRTDISSKPNTTYPLKCANH